MISFESDYVAGAHPKVLQRLIETNLEALSGYGSDCHTKRACEKIKAACGCEEAQVFLLTGGTQTNAIVISTMLESYEGVLAADTGHVGCHEAGAIEYSGHKVLTLPNHQGKVDSAELKAYLQNFYADENHEHMVFPGMLYISHPTEYGTLYSKRELAELANISREYDIPLYMDGARLGYCLMSKETDVTLADIARLCDVFYIGGTKVGALFGEAVVITNPVLKEDFRYLIKQHGGMLAKGRLLGLQFDALFTDDLYFKLGRHAIVLAEQIRNTLSQLHIPLLVDNPTNQIFPIMSDAALAELGKSFTFTEQERVDETHRAVRLCTSWATTQENVDKLCEDICRIYKNLEN